MCVLETVFVLHFEKRVEEKCLKWKAWCENRLEIRKSRTYIENYRVSSDWHEGSEDKSDGNHTWKTNSAIL